MFSTKHKTAVLAAAGALALSVPAAAGAAIGFPGLGLLGLGATQSGPAPTTVASVVNANSGVLGADGPLGANGPLHGGGCLAANVNPNSLGMNGPLGPHGPLGPGGIGANLNCAAQGVGLIGFMPFG
jgi:hypothetical protein